MLTRGAVQPGRQTVRGRTEENDGDMQVMLGGNQQLLRAIHQEAACSMFPSHLRKCNGRHNVPRSRQTERHSPSPTMQKTLACRKVNNRFHHGIAMPASQCCMSL